MKVGKLVGINYSQLKVKISSEIRGGSVNLGGNIYYFGNIGSYLKISNALHEIIICEVVSIFDADQSSDSSFDIESNRELLLKPIGTINLDGAFELGVGIYPSLYSDVSIVTFEDMKIILQITESSELEEEKPVVHHSFPLGLSKNLINYPINVGIDQFFNIHSAVLGNSGSGKSNTIAHIIQTIHKKKNHSPVGSRLLLFDVNGEYKPALQGSNNNELSIKYFKPNITSSGDGYEPFYLPHFLLSLDEWSAFLLASDAAQRPFWDKVLQESYRFYRIGNADEAERNRLINYLRYKICNLVYGALKQADTDTAKITIASGILGSLHSLIESDQSLKEHAAELTKDIEALSKACVITYGENKNKLGDATGEVFEKVDQNQVNEVLNNKIQSGEYFDHKFLKVASELILLEEDARGNKQIRGYTATMLTRLGYFLDNPNCNFMRHTTSAKSKDDFLQSIWGESLADNQLVVIDTSELSPDILETLTSVVTRILFDERKRLSGSDRTSAPTHLILDEAHRYIRRNYEYLLKENIFEKISREGRKYAFYLLISSQRPSELSETVLSQCANFIIHRIQNERDMNYIKAILPYFSEDFTNKIKQSTPGEALVFGNCVSMPLHLKIHKATPGPDSENCNIPREWFKQAKDGGSSS